GLARVESGLGSLVAFATAPGAYALDGEGSNSPFTKSLLKHLETPGLEIRQLLTRVRDDVYRSTGGKQIPWDNSSLRSDFYFVPAIAADLQSAATSEHDREAERIFWESIQGSRSEADFQEFLRLYPNSVFAGLAERRLAELGAQSEAKQQVAAEAPLQKPVSISQASSRRSAQLLAESWGRRRYQVRYAISGTGSGGSASSICSGSDGVRVGIWKAIDPRDSRIELNDQSADRDIYTITSRDFEIGSDLLAATDNDSTFLVEYKYNNGLGRGWCPIKHVDSNLIKSLFVNNPYYRDHEIVVYENFLTWFSGIEFIVGSVKISTTDVVNNCLTFIGIRGRNRIDGFYCRDIRSSIAQSDLESVLSRLKIEGVIG
ncbi:MAG: caspase family protein, partial [Alphaproteobacteria bacterium]|nr:caspase family protein [Alphaproteobacteria bacterium]